MEKTTSHFLYLLVMASEYDVLLLLHISDHLFPALIRTLYAFPKTPQNNGNSFVFQTLTNQVLI